MQDGARVHTTKKNMAIIQDDLKVDVMQQWPPCSPDLNPIENTWGTMKMKLGSQFRLDQSQTQENKERLWKLVSDYFYSIPDEELSHYVASFSGRIAKVTGNGE
jgi:transposase